MTFEGESSNLKSIYQSDEREEVFCGHRRWNFLYLLFKHVSHIHKGDTIPLSRLYKKHIADVAAAAGARFINALSKLFIMQYGIFHIKRKKEWK